MLSNHSPLNTRLPLVYHPNYSFSFDPKHRFVMSKFANLYNEVKSMGLIGENLVCLLYTSPSPRDRQKSRMPSSA